MMNQFGPVLALIFGTLLIFSPVSAQSDNLRVTVANLSQDVNILAQQMNTLRLEVDAIRRENSLLRAEVSASSFKQNTQSQLSNLFTAIDALRREYRQADKAQKQQIITEVSRQIDALGKETQAALNTVAKAVGSAPNVATQVHFSEDYPKTGITYTVRGGDTLSKIARQHGSSVKHIQNANKIIDPSRDLQISETIFIPISE